MWDLISRQDAIDELWKINSSEDYLFIDAIVDMLENLPPVEQTAKVTDTWKVAGCETLNAWCPECEHRVSIGCTYCPTCGVKLDWGEHGKP